MPYSSKIVTCCYCGARAALVLKGRERHELACARCGAPLHELKMLRSDVSGARETAQPSPIRAPVMANPRPRKAKAMKRSKSLSQRFMEELKDRAEDIFDDVFDIFD